MRKPDIYRQSLLKPTCVQPGLAGIQVSDTCRNWSCKQPEKINCQLLTTLLASCELRQKGYIVEAAWTINAAQKNDGFKNCSAFEALFSKPVENRRKIILLRN